MFKRCFVFLIWVPLLAVQSGFVFIDRAGDAVSVDWVEKGSLSAEHDLFLRSLGQAYAKMSDGDLGVENKMDYIKDLFDQLKAQFKHDGVILARAKIQDRIVGFVSYQKTELPDQLYIYQFAIDPDFWGRGIGSELVFAALKRFPNTRSIVTNYHRANKTYASFVRALGFKQSNFLRKGYDCEKYHGMEWIPAKFLNLSKTDSVSRLSRR